MSLEVTSSVSETFKINYFSNVSDYSEAMNQNLIDSTEISFIGEHLQADWNQTDDTQPDYIRNKPSGIMLPSFNPSSDEGKVLQIVNGELVWVMPISVYHGNSGPDINLGHNNDIYIEE